MQALATAVIKPLQPAEHFNQHGGRTIVVPAKRAAEANREPQSGQAGLRMISSASR